MKRSGLVAVMVVALMGAGAAFAQQKPEVLVKQRQAVMTLQGKYYGPMAGMAQGKVPFNLDVVKRNSAFLDNLSRMAWDGFDASTKDVKSAALPAAYTDQAKFKDAAARLENEAHKLWEVAQRGDEGAIKAQIGAVGKSCGACHNDFRQKQ
jgi:cytochrome c556